MSRRTPQGWVADPRLVWNICLTARLDAPPDAESLRERLAALHEHHGWSVPRAGSSYPTVRAALEALATDTTTDPPLSATMVDDTLVLRGHHHYVDGLGLLATLALLTRGEVGSAARGRAETEDRPESNLTRLWEVVAAPPARVAESEPSRRVSGEALASQTVPGAHRVADLVSAATRGVVRWNTRHARPARHVNIAVGVSKSGGEVLTISENSALMRLRDVEALSREELRELMRSAAVTPGRLPGTKGPLARTALRILAPRLGSTLLVSHLGEVTAPGVSALGFYPVTGGGSGVSLGAVTLDGDTTLTLRARARQHSDEGLADLLEEICQALG